MANFEALYIWNHLGEHVAPTLVARAVIERGRGLPGIFRYHPHYLSAEQAYALDPIHFPMEAGDHMMTGDNGMAGCINDTLPDRWGRRVISRQHPGVFLSSFQYALLGDQNGVGSLSFSQSADKPPQVSSILREDQLPGVEEATRRLENEEDLHPEQKALLAGSGSMGGARRKAVFVRPDGNQWLAKFTSERDEVNVPRVEYAMMSLARRAGLDVPEVELLSAGSRPSPFDIFVIKRFDRTQLPSGGYSRTGFLSAQTLLGMRETQLGGSYGEIADVLTRLSPAPTADRIELYRRMAFNVIFNNTDDHLKNHGFLHEGGDAWRLSPLYDFVPQTNSLEHAISVNRGSLMADLDTVLAAAPAFTLTMEEASAALQPVMEAASDWIGHFREAGVSDPDIDRLSSVVQRAELKPKASPTFQP